MLQYAQVAITVGGQNSPPERGLCIMDKYLFYAWLITVIVVVVAIKA